MMATISEDSPVEHLRGCQARRGLDGHGVAGPEPAAGGVARNTAPRAASRQGHGLRAESAAKNLRTLRTGKLLVTVPDISNPFFSLILQGIEDAAQREGMRCCSATRSTTRSARNATR